MTDQIFGKVDNGRRRVVSIGSYAGPAGIQRATGEVQIAFLAKKQPTVSLPIACVVSGEQMIATRRESSDIPDMHIFICEYPS